MKTKATLWKDSTGKWVVVVYPEFELDDNLYAKDLYDDLNEAYEIIQKAFVAANKE